MSTDGGGTHPNMLVIMVDQMQYPRYGPGVGMLDDIKEIFGFASDLTGNAFMSYFPGLLALRENAVVLRNHSINSSACTPSRGTIFTGQFSSRTDLAVTDGMFKDGHHLRFPWLDPDGIPTMGDWFRAAGYDAHYFGKWHISIPGADNSLEPWGFADWEHSAPEPHGADPANLGVHRDTGFADLVVEFLQEKAQGTGTKPWLAVASLLNPHDIAGYPAPWFGGVQPLPEGPYGPLPIPAPGAVAKPVEGSPPVELNPNGFPQDNFTLPPTLHEDLTTSKPACQFDAAYKVGLALKSRWTPGTRVLCPLPFQLTDNEDGWFLAMGQFYTYLHYLVDLQLRRITQALQSSGLMNNTIVVFLSDHGEYNGAHGGSIEKWHTAYAETLHVPCVISSPSINPGSAIRYVDAPTSHIDLIPTLLGLAGFDATARAGLLATLATDHTAEPLPGADLTPVIYDPTVEVKEPDGSSRKCVLFVTDDTITEPLWSEGVTDEYQYFLNQVAEVIESGVPLQPGCVTQPCHVQCVRDTRWKLVRYWDPLGKAYNQWELYYVEDDNEELNLVGWTATGEPFVRQGVEIPSAWGIDHADVRAALDYLEPLLYETLDRLLGEMPGVEVTERSTPRRVRFGPGFRVASRLEEGAPFL